MYALAKPFIKHDREVTSKITKREWQLAGGRSSALLAPSTKSFPVLISVLDGFRKRNKMDLERKEREARKAGGSGAAPPSSSSAAAKKPPANAAAAAGSGASGGAAAASAIPALPPHLAAAGSSSASARAPHAPAAAAAATPSSMSRASSGGKGGFGKPVIVVPAAITAIVNMYNIKMMLEDNAYEPAAELKARGAAKDPTLSVRHTFDDGSYADFLVVDNPTTRLGAADWGNLVGVFAQGSTWQFKGWPFPRGAAELYAKCGGFSMRFTDEIPNQLTKGWAVTPINFSKEKTRKHEVGVAMSLFWEGIHKFMLRNKPHLLHKAK